MGIDKERIKNLCPPNSSLIIFYKKADKMIWPIHQKLLLEDATPRNLVIGKDIADDCLDTNIFRDSRGCHLRIVNEFLELLPLLALGEVRLHEPEVATGLALRHGKSHGGALANPVSANFPYMAGDVP